MVLTFCTHEHTIPPGRVQGFCLLTPNSVKDLHPYLHGVGGVMDNVVGVVNCHPCKLSLKYSRINGKRSC